MEDYPVVSLSDGTSKAVYTTHTTVRGQFFVQVDGQSTILEEIMEKLASRYSKLGPSDKKLNLKKSGALCAAKFIEDDNWYRAKITGVQKNGLIEVHFIDYGNTDYVDEDCIKSIDSDLIMYPVQSFKCVLAGVSSDLTFWTPEVMVQFEDLVMDKNCKAIFKSKIDDETYLVDMYDEDGKNINSIFGATCPASAFEEVNRKVGDKLQVVVVHCKNPNLFWCYESKSFSHILSLSEEMSRLHMTQKMKPLKCFAPGTVCATIFGVDDVWYRGIVRGVLGDIAEVYFVDYGNTEKLNLSKLMQLNSELLRYPAFGIKCCLAKTEHKHWPKEICEMFETLVMNKEFELHIVGKKGDTFEVALLDIMENADVGTHFKITVDDMKKRPDKIIKQDLKPMVKGFKDLVYLSWVESPGDFYVQRADSDSHLNGLSNQLQQIYSKPQPSAPATPGTIVVARFTEDKLWYRGIVLKEVDDDHAQVLFLDYGNSDIIHKDELRQVTNAFGEIKPLAEKCCLHGVKPLRKGDKSWTTDAKDFLEKMTEGGVTCEVVDVTNFHKHVKLTTNNNKDIAQELIALRVVNDAIGQSQVAVYIPNFNNQIYLIKSQKVSVTVSHIDSTQSFWCLLSKYSESLNDLMDQLNVHYSDEGGMPIKDPKVGQPCVSLYSEDNNWYRGRISKVFNDGFEVHFVDYGNKERNLSHNVCVPEPKFLDLPVQAIHCRLPLSEEASNYTDIFTDLVLEKELDLEVLDIENNQYIVELYDGNRPVSKLFKTDFPNSSKQLQAAPTLTPAKILPLNTPMKMYASYVSSPNKFFLQTSESEERVTSLMSKISNFYVDQKCSSAVMNPQVGQSCVALYSEDSSWYRGKIVSISGNHCNVLFVDYGNEEVISHENIRTILPEIANFPVMAYQCSLHSADKTEWPSSTKEYFASLIMDHELEGVFVSSSSVKLKKGDDDVLSLLSKAGHLSAPEWEDTSSSPSNTSSQRESKFENHANNRSTGFADRHRGRDEGFGSRDKGFGDRNTGFGDGDKGFGGRDKGFSGRDKGFSDREADRDTRFGDKNKGFGGRDKGFVDREAGFGDGDKGFGGRDKGFSGRDKGFSDREADRNTRFGDKNKGFGGRDKGFVDREAGFGNRNKGFGSGRDKRFGDREADRDTGFGDKNKGFGGRRGDQDRGFGDRQDKGFGDRQDKGFGDRQDKGFGDRQDKGFGDRQDKGFGDKQDKGFGDKQDKGFGYMGGGQNRGFSGQDHDTDRQTRTGFNRQDNRSCSSSDKDSVHSERSFRKGGADRDKNKPETVPSELSYPPPPLGTESAILIDIDDDGTFYLQLPSMEKDILFLSKKLASSYKTGGPRLRDEVQVGTLCCSKYLDGNMYRSQVEKIEGNKVVVRYIDYGNTSECNIQDLKFLFPDFLQIPVIAYPCQLRGLQWSSDYAKKFLDATLDKDIEVTFTNSNRPYQVDITTISGDLLTMLTGQSSPSAAHSSSKSINLTSAKSSTSETKSPSTNSTSASLVTASIPKQEFLPQTLLRGALTAYISYVTEDGYFYLQLEKDILCLEEISEKLNSTSKKVKHPNANVNVSCGAVFSEDSNWYRALITNISGEKAKVCFVDYGNTDTVTQSSIIPLSSELLADPPLAYKCLFQGSKPLTSEAQTKLQDYLMEHKVTVEFLEGSSPFYVKILTSDCQDLQDIICPSTSFKTQHVPCDVTPASVSHIEEDGRLFIQLYRDVQAISEFQTSLCNFYDSECAVELENFELGKPCCVVDEENSWHRAIIKQTEEQSVTLLLVDCGKTISVSKVNVKNLETQFLKFAPFAWECHLKGVENWTGDLKAKLAALTDGKVLNATFYTHTPPYRIALTRSIELDLLGHSAPVEPAEENCVKKNSSTSQENNLSMDTIHNPNDDVQENKLDMTVMRVSNLEVAHRIAISISYVLSPDKFFFHLEETKTGLDDLMDEMYNYFSTLSESDQCVKDVCVGQLCAVLYNDESWYRVRIVNVSQDTCQVFYIDHGNYETAEKAALHLLPEKFKQQPAWAIEGKLAGVSPLTGSWSEESMEMFRSLVEEKSLLADIINIDNCICIVNLLDMGDSVNVMLVKKGFATLHAASLVCKAVQRIFSDTNESAINSFMDSTHMEGDEISFTTTEYQEKHKLSCVADTLETLQDVLAFVSHSSSPSDFWCQLASSSNTLTEICESLTSMYTSPEDSDTIHDLSAGNIVVALFNEDDRYYRAEVMQSDRLETEASEKVLVRFIDYGNVSESSRRNTYKMREELFKYPIQAFSCCLDQIRSVENTWSPEACSKFSELVEEQELVLKLIGRKQNGTLLVDLMLPISRQHVASQLATEGFGAVEEAASETVFEHSSASCAKICDINESLEINPIMESTNVTGEMAPINLDSFTLDEPESGRYRYLHLTQHTEYDVIVTNDELPSSFHIQLRYVKGQYASLMAEIAEHISNSSQETPAIKPVVGEGCLVQSNGVWYRGEIVKQNNDSWNVRCVDLGCEVNAGLNDLRPLPAHFKTQPAQAIHCYLAGIVSLNAEWTPEAILFFKDSVQKKTLNVNVLEHGDDGKYGVYMFDMDDTCVQSINKSMVDMGFAEVVPGSNMDVDIQMEKTLDTDMLIQLEESFNEVSYLKCNGDGDGKEKGKRSEYKKASKGNVDSYEDDVLYVVENTADEGSVTLEGQAASESTHFYDNDSHLILLDKIKQKWSEIAEDMAEFQSRLGDKRPILPSLFDSLILGFDQLKSDLLFATQLSSQAVSYLYDYVTGDSDSSDGDNFPKSKPGNLVATGHLLHSVLSDFDNGSVQEVKSSGSSSDHNDVDENNSNKLNCVGGSKHCPIILDISERYDDVSATNEPNVLMTHELNPDLVEKLSSKETDKIEKSVNETSHLNPINNNIATDDSSTESSSSFDSSYYDTSSLIFTETSADVSKHKIFGQLPLETTSYDASTTLSGVYDIPSHLSTDFDVSTEVDSSINYTPYYSSTPQSGADSTLGSDTSVQASNTSDVSLLSMGVLAQAAAADAAPINVPTDSSEIQDDFLGDVPVATSEIVSCAAPYGLTVADSLVNLSPAEIDVPEGVVEDVPDVAIKNVPDVAVEDVPESAMENVPEGGVVCVLDVVEELPDAHEDLPVDPLENSTSSSATFNVTSSSSPFDSIPNGHPEELKEEQIVNGVSHCSVSSGEEVVLPVAVSSPVEVNAPLYLDGVNLFDQGYEADESFLAPLDAEKSPNSTSELSDLSESSDLQGSHLNLPQSLLSQNLRESSKLQGSHLNLLQSLPFASYELLTHEIELAITSQQSYEVENEDSDPPSFHEDTAEPACVRETTACCEQPSSDRPAEDVEDFYKLDLDLEEGATTDATAQHTPSQETEQPESTLENNTDYRSEACGSSQTPAQDVKHTEVTSLDTPVAESYLEKSGAIPGDKGDTGCGLVTPSVELVQESGDNQVKNSSDDMQSNSGSEV